MQLLRIMTSTGKVPTITVTRIAKSTSLESIHREMKFDIMEFQQIDIVNSEDPEADWANEDRREIELPDSSGLMRAFEYTCGEETTVVAYQVIPD